MLRSTSRIAAIAKQSFAASTKQGTRCLASVPPSQISQTSDDIDENYAGVVSVHYPTPFEKRKLVWAKIYKKIGDVPDKIEVTKMVVADDWYRIRAMSMMYIALGIAIFFTIRYGQKQRALHGDSLDNRALVWMEEARQEGLKEKEEARAKAAAAQSS